MYPQVCPFCGEISKQGICDDCRQKIVYVQEPRCFRCGKPLKEELEYCMDCRKTKRYFDQGRSLYQHQGMVAEAIYRLKFKNQRDYARLFAHEMAEQFRELLIKWDVEEIIPVPLHWRRRKERGFNQTEILARWLSRETHIPVEVHALLRVRETRRQKSLNHSQRYWNLEGAFGVSRNWKPSKNVLVIDDIYTTGSTINKAAKMLKKAGVQKVFFLTISIGQGL